MVLLIGLCLATLLYSVGNLSLRPAQHDGLQNLEMGIGLGRKPTRHGSEPFVPAVIAAVTLAQRALGYEPVADSCVDWHSERVETFQCRSAYAPYKILNVVFVLVAGIGVFFLCRWYAEVRWLPYFAFLLVTQSLVSGEGGMFDEGAVGDDTFYTEVPAAALLVMISCLSVLTLVRRRVLYSALLGLALAALVLTKVVFLYFWPFVVAGLIASDLLQRTIGWRTMLLVGVFLIVHFLPVGGWMVRNFVLFNEFSMVESTRVVLTLTRRSVYNTMRDDEFAAGFWSYTPYKIDFGIPKHSWERFDIQNGDGFLLTGKRENKRRNLSNWSRRKTQEREMAIARIFAEPWHHIKISTLLAWRSLFVQERLGHGRAQIELLRPWRLPRELSPGLEETAFDALDAHRRGKEAYIVWFREHKTAVGYSEAELKAFLNLETVAELADATLYRVPPDDGFVKRGVEVSEFLDTAGASAGHWADPSGMLQYFRESPRVSMVWSNHVPSLPKLYIAAPRLADVWGLDSWPRWGWQFDPLSKTLVNLVGFLALLAVPLWFWFGRRSRRIEIVFVMLPALYLHAVYAAASHFEPRYAEPEIPLRILAVLLLVCLIASSRRRLGGRAAERRVPAKRASPPAAPYAAGLRTQGHGGSLPVRLRGKAGRW